MKKPIRKIASNEIRLPDGKTLPLMVVEIRSGLVERYYSLRQELPFTEWMSGTIELRLSPDGALQAYREGVLLQ